MLNYLRFEERSLEVFPEGNWISPHTSSSPNKPAPYPTANDRQGGPPLNGHGNHHPQAEIERIAESPKCQPGDFEQLSGAQKSQLEGYEHAS